MTVALVEVLLLGPLLVGIRQLALARRTVPRKAELSREIS